MDQLPCGGDWIVVVPSKGSSLEHQIARGSAIVVHRKHYESDGEGAPLAYFEGGLFQEMAFSEKLIHASDRAFLNYPTIAKLRVRDVEDLVVVGQYDRDLRILWLQDEQSLSSLETWGVSKDDVLLATASGLLAEAASERYDFCHRVIGCRHVILVKEAASPETQKILAQLQAAAPNGMSLAMFQVGSSVYPETLKRDPGLSWA